MNSEFHDIIRAIAEALYRSTGAVPLYLTIADVRDEARRRDYQLKRPLTDAECMELMDLIVDGAEISHLIETGIEVHRDTLQEANGTVDSLIRDIELKLAELQGAVSIAVTGGQE